MENCIALAQVSPDSDLCQWMPPAVTRNSLPSAPRNTHRCRDFQLSLALSSVRLALPRAPAGEASALPYAGPGGSESHAAPELSGLSPAAASEAPSQPARLSELLTGSVLALAALFFNGPDPSQFNHHHDGMTRTMMPGPLSLSDSLP
eukprot:3467063-Rhodomonas_salina.1